MDFPCRHDETDYEGLPALVLENGLVQLTILPSLGGKISSIKDLSTGREWLWQNPHLPMGPVQYDASFVEQYDTGGLDECFPAVSGGVYPAEPWQGAIIPDHGELWCQPWQYEWLEASAERLVLKMGCYGVRFPYHFTRTLTLSAGSASLRLAYTVTNLTGFDFPFIWSVHPLMNIEPGMTLRLPASVAVVYPEGSTPGFLGDYDTAVAWPLLKRGPADEIDLSIVPQVGVGQAAKLYSARLTGSEPVVASLADPSGQHAFSFRFRPDEITHIGLWLNYSAWAGYGSEPYFNLGLEPCIGDSDDLAKLTSTGRAAILAARKVRKWSLELNVS